MAINRPERRIFLKKILFVCTGNTCRSPMAEAVFNKRAREAALPYFASSAGISAIPSPISDNAKEALRRYGISDFSHTATGISRELLETQDMIIGMTERHAAALVGAFPDLENKIFSFPTDISDPYGLGIEDYCGALSQIEAGIAKILDVLQEKEKVEILPLSPEYIDDIIQVEKECFSEPWSKEAFRELLTHDHAVYFTAVKENSAIGYVGMYKSFDEGAITNIAVHPHYRGRKVATKLLSALIGYCKENGIATLSLEVRKSNKSAISLYEKFGFTLVGERKGFYRKPTEDALLYNLNVSERETL